MSFTRTSFIRSVKILTAITIGCIIIGYATWRSLNYVRGPSIEIFEPINGSAIENRTTIIRGQSKRVNNLTLNGNPVFIDEESNFHETIIVFPGVNRITITGEDRFKRQTSTLLEIVGKSDFPTPSTTTPTIFSTPSMATSTATSTTATSTETNTSLML